MTEHTDPRQIPDEEARDLFQHAIARKVGERPVDGRVEFLTNR